MIDFLLLGTGAMTPLPERWLSSLLVRCGGDLILFDCGEGTQIPWRRYGWGFRKLSAICISHWHADHIAGLPGILHTVANSGRTEPLQIVGPAGIAPVIDGLRTIAPHLPFPIEVTEIVAPAAFDLTGDLVGSAIAGEHRLPSLIFRVDLPRAPRFDRERAASLRIPQRLWSAIQSGDSVEIDGRSVRANEVVGPPRPGLSFGFATDTRPVDAAPEFLRGVDLLICEGTYGDSADHPKAVTNKHMTFREAATIARDAGAGRLLLTHFSPAMSQPKNFLHEATSVFAETVIGESGLELTLNFRDD